MGSEGRPETKSQDLTAGTHETWPKVAVIVLNWNGWQDTIECLESLQRITYPNYQIIVVDNDSTDDSIEKIKAWARGEIPVESKFFDYDPTTKPVHWIEYDRATGEEGGIPEEEDRLASAPPDKRLILIQTGANLGFSAGNNVGLHYSLRNKAQYFLLLNNDTVVTPSFLNYLVSGLTGNPDWGAVGAKILYKGDPTRIWYAGGQLAPWRAAACHLGMNDRDSDNWSGCHQTQFITGCCFLARRKFFDTVGLLDEDFFFGHEDAALAYLARAKNIRIGVNLDAVIYHESSGVRAKLSPRHAYLFGKNRLLLLRKYATPGERLIGYAFYALTRGAKFLLLCARGNPKVALAEVRAIADFLKRRYGDYDRKRAMEAEAYRNA